MPPFKEIFVEDYILCYRTLFSLHMNLHAVGIFCTCGKVAYFKASFHSLASELYQFRQLSHPPQRLGISYLGLMDH
jgi:hypothetical protein